jgi:hypothetical protein
MNLYDVKPVFEHKYSQMYWLIVTMRCLKIADIEFVRDTTYRAIL